MAAPSLGATIEAMRNRWLGLVDRALRPARPRFEPCLREGESHRAARRVVAERRAAAIASCEREIERERRAVFAADDGVVRRRMTDLEREWRTVSRSDPDDGLMDLWARIAPASWIDRKRWRDGDEATRLDVAVGLAADVSGVEAAEAAAASFRLVLSAWGVPIGPRIRWRSFDRDVDCVTSVLERPRRAAQEALGALDGGHRVLERARALEGAVREAAIARFRVRPLLAEAFAQASFVDALFPASPPADRPNPVTPLRTIFETGYVLGAIDDASVTLDVPGIVSLAREPIGSGAAEVAARPC
jgi:hypothetical protein